MYEGYKEEKEAYTNPKREKSVRTTNKNEINIERHVAIEPRRAALCQEPPNWGTVNARASYWIWQSSTTTMSGYGEAEGESMTMGALPPPSGLC